MAIDCDTHAQARQAFIVMQVGVAIGDQHQRHCQVLGNLLEVFEVLHAYHTDTIGTGLLVALGAHDDFFGGEHASIGTGNDRQ